MISPSISFAIIAQACRETVLAAFAARDLHDAESALSEPVNLCRGRQHGLFASSSRLLACVVTPGKEFA